MSENEERLTAADDPLFDEDSEAWARKWGQAADAGSSSRTAGGVADFSDTELDELLAFQDSGTEPTSARVLVWIAADVARRRQDVDTAELAEFVSGGLGHEESVADVLEMDEAAFGRHLQRTSSSMYQRSLGEERTS